MKKNIFLCIVFLNFARMNTTPPALHNFGNTCYLNSTIQCLYNIDYIKNLLLFSYRINPYPSPQSTKCIKETNENPNSPCGFSYLFTQLVKNINDLQQKPYGSLVYSTAEEKLWSNQDSPLRQFVNKAYTIMGGCGQQDAPEFFDKLIDSLIYQDSRYKFTDPEQALRTHPVGKTIKIEVASSLYCSAVQYKSTKLAAKTRLEIPISYIENNRLKILKTLTAGLDKFTEEEHITDFKPEGYTTSQNCTKKLQLEETSDIVIISLNRFAFDPVTVDIKKIDDKITIPMNINFRKYFTDGAQKKPIPTYDLIAAAEQLGTTVQSGHYVAHIKEPSGQWYYCSDSTIRKETQEQAQEAINKSYILVYRKSDKK